MKKEIKSMSKSTNPSRVLLLLLLFILLSHSSYSSHAANFWFASPTGLAGNTGAIGSPWDLQTALNKTLIILPGDTLYLRDGIYTHAPQSTGSGNEGYIFECTLLGTSSGRITLRSYPGEQARIDGGAFPAVLSDGLDHAVGRPTLLVGGDGRIGTGSSQTIGAYITLQDLEIFSSSTQTRLSTGPDASGSFPPDVNRSSGVVAQGKGTRIINCVFHNLASGIESFASSSMDHEYYGNVLFDNGWQGVHAHGHNMYLQGPLTVTPTGAIKLVKRNFSGPSFDKGVQAYGTGTSTEGHYHFLENVWLGSGTTSRGGVLIGMRNGAIADRIIDSQFIDNYGYNVGWSLYFQPDPIAYLDCLATGNYFVKSSLQVSSWKNLTFTNNYLINNGVAFQVVSLWQNVAGVSLPWDFNRNFYYINPATGATNVWNIEGQGPKKFNIWQSTTGYDANSTVLHTYPTTNYVILQNNIYDTDRGQVAAYNFSLGTNIVLSVVPLAWSPGDTVTIRNLQNYFGDVVNATISPSRTLNLDMRAASHTISVPYGDTAALSPKSFPDFGAFLLERTSTNPPVIVTHTLTVNSSNPSVGVTIDVSPPDNNGATVGATAFTRLYNEDDLVTLTAPAIGPGSTTFTKWQYNSVDFSTAAAITVTNSADATVKAFFTSPPAPPAVDYRRSALRRRVL